MKTLALVVGFVVLSGCASLIARGVLDPDTAAADCATIQAICADPLALVDPRAQAACRLANASCVAVTTSTSTTTTTTTLP